MNGLLTLQALFEAWCRQEGLPEMSADEFNRDDLNYAQKEVVNGFIELWDREVKRDTWRRNNEDRRI